MIGGHNTGDARRSDGGMGTKRLRDLLAGERLPWKVFHGDAIDDASEAADGADGPRGQTVAYDITHPDQAELIVAAVNTLPGLLDDVAMLCGLLREVVADETLPCTDCGDCVWCGSLVYNAPPSEHPPHCLGRRITEALAALPKEIT